MHEENIIKAIQSSNRFNKKQAKLLKILYKTSVDGESDVTYEFLSSKCKISKQYICKLLKELKENGFIDFAKNSHSQVFILNTEALKRLLKSYELKLDID